MRRRPPERARATLPAATRLRALRLTLRLAPAALRAEHVDLSEDQKPDTPDEMKRIKKRGGFVSPPEEEWGGPARVWLDANMTLPGLAMARSIGDHLVSAVGVIAEPEVKKFSLGKPPEDEAADGPLFIVMASDGVWEFIDNDEAVAIVGQFYDKGLPALDACRFLIAKAALCWRKFEGDYRDDITAIVVYLPDVVTALELERGRWAEHLAEHSSRRQSQQKTVLA